MKLKPCPLFLKPCPFCGHPAQFAYYPSRCLEADGVCCTNSKCKVSVFAYGKTPSIAARRWNRRAPSLPGAAQ
jgi:hypothetical protein